MSESKEKKIKFGTCLVLVLTSASVLYALLLFSKLNNNIPIYNLFRTLVFSFASLYLFLRPSKINLISSFMNSGSENSADSNIKMARALSILISILNLCISLAFFYE